MQRLVQQPLRVLGLGADATEATVKSAYKKLARELHPDRNPDDPVAARRFQNVQQAYLQLIIEGGLASEIQHEIDIQRIMNRSQHSDICLNLIQYAEANAGEARNHRFTPPVRPRISTLRDFSFFVPNDSAIVQDVITILDSPDKGLGNNGLIRIDRNVEQQNIRLTLHFKDEESAKLSRSLITSLPDIIALSERKEKPVVLVFDTIDSVFPQLSKQEREAIRARCKLDP